MNSRWIEARQTRYAAYLTVYILVVLAIISVANVLANRYNKSYDSTSNKRYSLSDQTAKIVKGLPQPANVTYYDKTSNFQGAQDLLGRYTALSSKVHLNLVDPDKTPQVARAAGITKYGTTIVQIGARTETAKSLTEDEITGAMIRDLKSNTRTVCFTTGNGEHLLDDADRAGYSRLKDALDKDKYEVKAINLLEKGDVPAECTVVVVGGPQTEFQQPEVDALKKYVEQGGRAMFLLDPPLKIGRPTSDNEALMGVLQGWGVTPERDLLLDQNPVGQLMGVSVEVALITKYEVHPIVNEMRGTASGIPLARSLTIKNTDKTLVEKLFDSSESSFATTRLDTAAINTKDPQNKKGPLTLGAAGSYHTGKPDSEGRFVVIGSSSWPDNAFIRFNGNSDLALNAMNWLSSDEDLISIRPKPPEDRKISMTTAQFNWVRLSSQFFFPAALLLAGLSVWWRRR